MRAWQVVIHGEPAEALEQREAPVPEPGEGMVTIDVDAAALALPDVFMCRGVYPLTPKVLPFTPGQEVVGRVRAVGPGVDLAIGTEGHGRDRLLPRPGRVRRRGAGPGRQRAPGPGVARRRARRRLRDRLPDGVDRSRARGVASSPATRSSCSVPRVAPARRRCCSARPSAPGSSPWSPAPTKAERVRALGADVVIDRTAGSVARRGAARDRRPGCRPGLRPGGWGRRRGVRRLPRQRGPPPAGRVRQRAVARPPRP